MHDIPILAMTAPVTDRELSSALLNSIKDGTYPESESVLVAQVPAQALSLVLQDVQDARSELEVV